MGWMQYAGRCCGDCSRGDGEELSCLKVFKNGVLIGFLTRWGIGGTAAGNTKCKGGLMGASYCNPLCDGTLSCAGDAIASVNELVTEAVTLDRAVELGRPVKCDRLHPNLWHWFPAGMYISVGTMGIKWLGSPTVGCTTVDLTFNYYRFTSPNTCVGFDVTVNSQPLDWYIYGVTFVDPVTLDEFFIIQCDATYPRPITRPAPTCFLVRRPDGTYDIYKDYMVYYYGAVDTHNTSSCGEAISRLGASSALGGRFSWNISGDHDQICFYWSAPHEDGSQRKVCIPWVAKWWETELPLNVDGYTIEDISDCVTLPPPCEPYLCFPSCLVKSCDSVVNPSALFLDVESLNGCCLDGSYEFTWDSGTNHYYSGKIGDPFLVTCGYVEIWYECSGSTFRRRVKITDINGNVSDTTQNAPGGCSGSPQNFHDTFDVTSFIGLPLCANESPFFSDTVTFVIQTNN